ncbi:hypothetical protein [Flavobacterium sedimenticola]|uniref:Lipoprotein n=1 Tax=Flavobacterium sedimenticola TaxID=3043286 RepID=A0ABT6XMS1_9FLAO|nr:hypothetical protein [Flavobacterium sedimenticola]MDI9256157.1 hypothetical protein [Flavobacterium sedimenticola]
MKRIISLIALVFVFNACSVDDGNDFLFELLPVESVDIPTEFTMGETYQIKMYYRRPTTCHSFNTIYYDKDLNVRTIAIESAVRQASYCEELTENNLVECSFNFLVTSNGSYIFKFYQGQDEQGNNIFLQYEVPVTN